MFSSFTKPFSSACERNKEPIAEVLGSYLGQGGAEAEGCVLELGSGMSCAVEIGLVAMSWKPPPLAPLPPIRFGRDFFYLVSHLHSIMMCMPINEKGKNERTS